MRSDAEQMNRRGGADIRTCSVVHVDRDSRALSLSCSCSDGTVQYSTYVLDQYRTAG
jgi:hypothetical protein